MKKLVVLSFVSLIILAFGATVYGQEKAPVLEFKASGFIDAQSAWFRNATQGNTGSGIYAAGATTTFAYTNNFAGGNPVSPLDKTVAFWESRARLKFDAIYGKELSGTIFFEFDAGPWGTGAAGTRNSYGYWGGDRDSLEVKNIYFDFGLPYFGIPVPITFRVGEQTMGIRPTLLMVTDGIGVTAAAKFDPVLIQFMYGKPWEGDVGNADDADMYAIHANVKVSTLTAGGYWLHHNMNTYPLPAAGVARNNQATMHWFGGYLDGKLGPVNINIDAIFDTGKVEARSNAVTGVTPGTVSYGGYLFHGKFQIPWEKFNFGVVAYYASGADTEKTSSSGLPGVNPNRADGRESYRVNSYVVPVSSESGSNYGESIVLYSFWGNRGSTGIANNSNYTQTSRGPVGGTWMVKGFAGFKGHPDHKFTLQGLYIGDTTKNGNTFGTSRDSFGRLEDSNSVGWEIDGIWEWQLYKQLKLTAASGVLFRGNAMKLWTGVGTENHTIKLPWSVLTNLTYTF
jgi:hypothetical protein